MAGIDALAMGSRRHFMSATAPAALAALASACAAPREGLVQPRGAMARVFDDGAALPGLRSLLLWQGGALLGERYYAGVTPTSLQALNSVTKSVSAMLVGQALQRGQLIGLDQPLSGLLPEVFLRYPDSPARHLTLGRILSGHSGMAYDFSTQFWALQGAVDPIEHVLGLPVLTESAPRWSYNDAAISLIAPILQRACGADLAALAQRELFAPLGIEHFSWRRDRLGQPTSYAGLALRPRDVQKLAGVMLDAGQFQGRQVLPASWVAQSVQPRGPASWRIGSIADIGYGQLWFTGRIGARRVAWAWGYGGQLALLVPETRVAVVSTATSPPPQVLRPQTDAIMGLIERLVDLG